MNCKQNMLSVVVVVALFAMTALLSGCPSLTSGNQPPLPPLQAQVFQAESGSLNTISVGVNIINSSTIDTTIDAMEFTVSGTGEAEMFTLFSQNTALGAVHPAVYTGGVDGDLTIIMPANFVVSASSTKTVSLRFNAHALAVGDIMSIALNSIAQTSQGASNPTKVGIGQQVAVTFDSVFGTAVVKDVLSPTITQITFTDQSNFANLSNGDEIKLTFSEQVQLDKIGFPSATETVVAQGGTGDISFSSDASGNLVIQAANLFSIDSGIPLPTGLDTRVFHTTARTNAIGTELTLTLTAEEVEVQIPDPSIPGFFTTGVQSGDIVATPLSLVLTSSTILNATTITDVQGNALDTSMPATLIGSW